MRRTAANHHSRVAIFPHNISLYHLYSRPFFHALGDPNNRNRRRRSLSAVKAKLMALDFVLAHPDLTYFATEREKLDYFSNSRGIGSDLLPKKSYASSCSSERTVRYFVDKLPIFLAEADSDSPPVVSFAYVDPAARSLAGFRSFLSQYRQLFRQLGRFRLWYVAGTERHFEAAERQLRKLVRSVDSDEFDRSSTSSLLENFRLEVLYRNRRFDDLTKAKLIELKRARIRFSGPEIDPLFELWKRDDDQAVITKMRDRKPPEPAIVAEFRTSLLEHNYAFLGPFSRR